MVALASMFPTLCRLSLVAMLCLAVGTVASAQSVTVHKPDDVPQAKPAAPGERGGSRFSLGAGLSYSDVGGGLSFSNGLVSPSYNPSYVPSGTALLEVAVTPRLRLMLGVTGNYTKRLRGSEEQPTGGIPRRRWTAGVGLGARVVLNPGGLVEVAPAVLLGLRRGHMFTSGTSAQFNSETGRQQEVYTEIDSGNLGLEARLGLTLERLLLERLYLRFEGYFLRAGSESTSQSTSTSNAPPVRTSATDIGLGWGLSMSLQLRLAF